ncbi:hypothetical protein WCLP8_420012 [uncultured Gammaproteobacteria bacterium]
MQTEMPSWFMSETLKPQAFRPTFPRRPNRTDLVGFLCRKHGCRLPISLPKSCGTDAALSFSIKHEVQTLATIDVPAKDSQRGMVMSGFIGINGCNGRNETAPQLIEGVWLINAHSHDYMFSRAGLAILSAVKIEQRYATTNEADLIKVVAHSPLAGTLGIAHSDWANFGAVIQITTAKKEIKFDAHSQLALVYHGTINNGAEVKAELIALGHIFTCNSEAEIIGHLIAEFMLHRPEPLEAMTAALDHLQGRYAVAMILAGFPDVILGAQRGMPLVLGHGLGKIFVVSDPIAVSSRAASLTVLAEGDTAEISRFRVVIRDRNGLPSSCGD